MANPVQVTISATGFTPCSVTLYQSNPSATHPDSVEWVNNSGSSVVLNIQSAGSYLATTAPPNQNNAAKSTATLLNTGTLTLWVKDNAPTNKTVSYSLQIADVDLTCTTSDPPEILIEP